MKAAKTPQRRERFAMRITAQGFAPADTYTNLRLREKRYRQGDLVFAELFKPRNPKFYRYAHKFGQMCAENIDDFAGMPAHQVLKRLQWEAGIGCEELGVKVPGVGYMLLRLPRSLAFESMEDGEFREVMQGFCRHIATTYWPTLSVEKIGAMAEIMVDEGA